MNSERFNRWFEWLMQWEGEVYENDPDDPGGETKFGIDKRSHPHVDIKGLTRDQAKRIYWNEYWGAVKAEEMPAGVGEVVADIAVNNGRSRASRWLQREVGAVEDGIIGPGTLALIQKANTHKVKTALLDRREQFYRDNARGKTAKFLGGWLNRNNSLRRLVE